GRDGAIELPRRAPRVAGGSGSNGASNARVMRQRSTMLGLLGVLTAMACTPVVPTGGAGGAGGATPWPGCVAEVSAGFARTCARREGGTLWCWGANDFGQLGDGTRVDKPLPVQVTALGASVVEVSAGGWHTCVRKSDGTVWCWGLNETGQLGDG